MEQPGLIKSTTFGGFERKSVLQYIDELTAQGKEKEEHLNAKINQLEQTNREITEALEKMRVQTQEIVQNAEVKGKRAQDLERSVAELQAELQRQQTVCGEQANEINVQRERYRQMELRAESMETKSRKYDDALLQIGSVLMEAKQGANNILRDAEEKAGRLTSEALDSIRDLTARIGGFKGDVNSLRGTLQSSIAQLQQRLDAIDHSIDSLDEAVQIAGSQWREEHTRAAVESRRAPVGKPDETAEAQQPPAAPAEEELTLRYDEETADLDELTELFAKTQEPIDSAPEKQQAQPAQFFW